MLPENHFVAFRQGRLVHVAPTLDDLVHGLRRRGEDERAVVIEYVTPVALRKRVF